MSDRTFTFDGIEFDAESIISAINENLTDDPDAYEGENTTGLTITDDYVIVGDGCDDPDATVARRDTEESIVVSLTTLREEAENVPEPFTQYLNDRHYIYAANEVLDPEDTPITHAEAVVKHDRSEATGPSELVHAEVNGINGDDNVEFSQIRADDDGVLYVGVTDKRDGQ